MKAPDPSVTANPPNESVTRVEGGNDVPLTVNVLPSWPELGERVIVGGVMSPRTMLVPVRAETGMSPQMVSPDTVMPEASTQDDPLQYSMVWRGVVVVMQTCAVPSVMPMTLTS